MALLQYRHKHYLGTDINEIISGCKRKSYRYQKKLYDTYSSLLYAICYRYFRNSEDANDCLQDAFIKIYDKIENFKNEGSFEGWIKKVQVNTCLMHLRARKKQVFLEDLSESVQIEEEEVEDDFLNIPPKVLFTLIQDLPAGYRTVFNLYVLDGYNHKEIANELGLSVGTSKSQLARSKKVLKEKLQVYINER